MTTTASTRTTDDDRFVICDAAGRYLFEVMAGTDERGDYVQVRGRMSQITVEPRADNLIRVRVAPPPTKGPTP